MAAPRSHRRRSRSQLSIAEVGTRLVAVRDDDFDGLIFGVALRNGELRLPPGGVDHVETLVNVRTMVARLHDTIADGAWFIVVDDEVVGLCSYRRPPASGCVEIGYGIAPERRNRGHATRAVAAMASRAAASGTPILIAATAIVNPASGRVLEKTALS